MQQLIGVPALKELPSTSTEAWYVVIAII
jgi:hypothetical protein